MQIQTLDDLLDLHLQTLYDVENQLISALPRFSEAAQSPDLKQRLADHLRTTKTQLKRLEDIAEEYDLSLSGYSDPAMASLIRENQDLVSQIGDPVLIDTAILGGADKIEHYEMAAYQAAASVAHKLGRTDIVDALNQTRSEEQRAAEGIETMSG